MNDIKPKDHFKELERRLELWQSGNSLGLFQDILTIQRNLKSVYKAKKIDQISGKFAEETQNDNVNGTLKLLTNNIQHGFPPLNEEKILKLKMKHPKTVNPKPEVLLPDGVPMFIQSDLKV